MTLPHSNRERPDPWLASADPALSQAQHEHELAYRDMATRIERRMAGLDALT